MMLRRARGERLLATCAMALLAASCGGDSTSPEVPDAAAPAKLAFTVQPTAATAGETLAPAVAVAIQDAFGNTVPSATNGVTVSLAANPAGGTLSGTTTVNAVGGVASFGDLRIDKVGNGYTLAASSPPLTSATSGTFSVVPGPVASVWVNPGAAVLTFPVGSISIQLQATPLDANGSSVPSTVVWSTSDPNVATVDTEGFVVGNQVGVAMVSASAEDQVGTATIAVSCVPPRCSRPFDLTFAQEPTDTRAGEAVSPPVQVSITSTGSTWPGGVLSIVLGYNPGNGSLTGNSEVSVSGYPTTTWSDLRITKPGSGYTLVAIVESMDGRVWGTSSAAFDITP